MNPIWKDYYLTITPDPAGVPFEIVDRNMQNTVIFSGRAYQRPGGGSIKLRLNDIAADCFHRHFDPAESDYDRPTARLGVEYGSGTTTAPEFYQDWSYDRNFSQSDWLNRPIGNYVVQGQYLPITGLGTSRQVTIYYNNVTVDYPTASATTSFIDLSTFANLKGVRLGANGDYIKAICAKWVVYYINQYGGWDWCVLRGGVTEGDTVQRYTTDKIYNNSDPYIEPRGTDNYASEVVHTYTMRTGSLDEQASGRVHHLVTTTNAWLHNLETNVIVPIVITTNSMQYTKNGRFAQYEITAQLAQQRRR